MITLVIALSLLARISLSSLPQDTTDLVSMFAGKASFAQWTYTLDSKQQTSGTAYIECNTPTQRAILGTDSLPDRLIFSIRMWKFGMRTHSTLSFEYEITTPIHQRSLLVRELHTNWYVFSSSSLEPCNVELNNTHLSIRTTTGQYSFRNYNPPSPLHLMILAMFITFGANFLLSGTTYERNFEHLAICIFSSKLVSLALMGSWTAITTLQSWSALFLSLCAFIAGFFTVKFIWCISISWSQSVSYPRLIRYLSLTLLEAIMFGQFEYQFLTIVLALLIQLRKKYNNVQAGWPRLEEQMFIMAFLSTAMFNSPWMLFVDNIYKIPPPSTAYLVVFAVICTILVLRSITQCIVLILPKYQYPRKKFNFRLEACAICSKGIGFGNVILAQCCHNFHMDCVMEYQKGTKICPIDRMNME